MTVALTALLVIALVGWGLTWGSMRAELLVAEARFEEHVATLPVPVYDLLRDEYDAAGLDLPRTPRGPDDCDVPCSPCGNFADCWAAR